MKGVEVGDGGDLHANDGIGLGDTGGCAAGTDTTGFDAMEDEAMGVDDGEIWLDRDPDDLLDVHDNSIFYDDFPPLPDFPCMSSSSSSSSAPAPVKSIACSSSSSSVSSSSAASWAVLKSDAEEDEDKKNHRDHHDPVEVPPAALSSTASMEIPREGPDQGLEDVDCMNVMENFGYMDLLEPNDIWDPSSLFHMDDSHDFEAEQQPQQEQEQPKPQPEVPPQQQDEEYMVQRNDEEGQRPSEDLAMLFFEWLKSNKESISPEDLRNIKLKRATIECAAKRLGGGKEGMKQLLKLILEWVQNHQLQKKRISETQISHFPYNYQDPFATQSPNPNPNPSPIPNISCNPIPPDPNPCFPSPHWLPQPPYMTDPSPVMVPPPFPPMVGYMGDPFANGPSNINSHPYQPTSEYHILDSTNTWQPPQFSLASPYTSFSESNLPLAPAPQPPQAFAGYGNQFTYQYFPGNGERLTRLGSSATKEARKKRMARQRRVFSHHHRHHNHHNQQQQNPSPDQQARPAGNEGCNSAAQANQANWVFWPSAGAASNSPAGAPDAPQPPPPPAAAAVDRQAGQAQNNPRQLAAERRQGWKPEKNLKFLLQKVLKQSDVGNLGRIVLPKKEAETHLPELEARDGITIPMEDIGTSRVWNMRYRFWPNNKSRMYLLENTGDFVRSNGLQEGDFIVIYSDVKCGKYMIRGVKVRQSGPKSESKRSGKSQRNQQTASPAGNGSTPSLSKRTTK
ncbi:hypothetical protein PVL29_009063 [Vitis rotundifolia]|uniref:TF-B3 domain-containing protein n=1 Tax=Vitis rotundifolia TaxID=103349 RepID=A0AA38ZXH7_VITRO|nr:hypothetical protein PVL29_009063 [Vitis rotundifolia]